MSSTARCHPGSSLLRLACLASLLGLGATASAGTVSSVSYQAAIDPRGGTAMLKGFDASLGTLQSVRVEAGFDIHLTISETGFCGVEQDRCLTELAGEASAEVFFTLGQIWLSAYAEDRYLDVCVTAPGQPINCQGSLHLWDQQSSEATDAATLSAFSGVETFAMQFSWEDFLGSDRISSPVGEGAKFVVTYQYLDATQAVPEPASLALVAIAGAALVGTRRRR